MIFPGNVSMMPYLTHGKSRAINAENRTGEKGRGGMAASPLGPSRKGKPCLTNIQPGQEEILADIEGPVSFNIYGLLLTRKPQTAIVLF